MAAKVSGGFYCPPLQICTTVKAERRMRVDQRLQFITGWDVNVNVPSGSLISMNSWADTQCFLHRIAQGHSSIPVSINPSSGGTQIKEVSEASTVALISNIAYNDNIYHWKAENTAKMNHENLSFLSCTNEDHPWQISSFSMINYANSTEYHWFHKSLKNPVQRHHLCFIEENNPT